MKLICFFSIIFFAFSCQEPHLQVVDSMEYKCGYFIVGYNFKDSIEFSDSIIQRVFKGDQHQYEFEKTPVQIFSTAHLFSVQTTLPTGFGRESIDYINLK